MFDRIIAYSIKHKYVVGFMVIVLIGVGSYSLKTLPIDALPDITNNQVQVITTSPNLATQEVELFITYPIELAVKSIPHIVELRSVSKFGLSLVTIVFEEDVDIYWARTQIIERLKTAENDIPDGFGTPELAPISTGLGEIFQYTVSAAEGFADQFDIMELRSIQDWMIVPQLLGTKGIAEVNTLGGVLKEYEVAVNPNKLKSMGITMAEIFDALVKNNQNAGGAYIDKKPNAYFIRSVGMVNSLDDVSKIVVKINNDIPVLIRDVAEIQYGNTVRYGATTRNGKGEVVNGMVMMLKGANSAEVVALVKERIEEIKKTLPEGVEINPYLDRSKLVDKAISTVRTNLIEGALIVVFILVLLIGNWRAGLIVASVIPLALLFAVAMMRWFGVSGNLMSLGAIDFGLIVDGAVIIVEAIVHHLRVNTTSGIALTRQQMDDKVYSAASGIRKSAAFGEIIILIVYLPILALVGIEGKMFAPMAKTVAFAILGAFILSLTYVPMMSALLLNKNINHKENISDKIIGAIQRLYTPVLNFALRFKILMISVTVGLFIVALWVFNGLGGEFIPTLSEGDIATHVMIPPGSSLTQEIHSTTMAEQLLLANFPEIEQVVSKIGSAEVPTDPMPMEVADVMVIMKDQDEWTSASTKEEMFEKMEKVLDDLPGVTTEFSQPIQMRFNELMTGIRSDVGIKIFGEDIELLVSMGDRVTELVKGIQGVEDARAETVSGLPQITIKFDKDKLALYGLNVSDLNQAISMGFAGSPAGVVYEGEKRYNLVVRLAEPFRQDISNIENLYVSLPSGNQVPLGQVADIKLERVPAQISREDGKRRIIVGFNVRNRDVESVVEEIQTKIANQINLPVGYYLQYAGQFENLKRAKSRLAIAVPIALVLIFVLLYITFGSMYQSVLIFTAIPLSAIGGIVALWARGMPFSISAGIGFIALFGVAVLNGIVLISYFNQLKKEGMTNIIERIKIGTSVRLRPVIMTATVASMGFLPMALSTSAGAEVQKPLATVVIGGLVTATLLTLIILPILYYFVEKFKKGGIKPMTNAILIAIMCTLLIDLSAQSNEINTLEQAIEIATQSNGDIKAAQLSVQRYQQLESAAYILPKADIDVSLGQMNTRSIDHSYSIAQRFNPFLAKVKKAFAQEKTAQGQIENSLAMQELKYHIRTAWDMMAYQAATLHLLTEQKIIWDKFASYANHKFDVGESGILEKTTAEVRLQSINQAIRKARSELQITKMRLQATLNTDESINPTTDGYTPLTFNNIPDTTLVNHHPLLQQARQEILVSLARSEVDMAMRRPEFKVGYFIQSIRGSQEVDGAIVDYNGIPRFQGVKLGMSLPIFRKGDKANIQANETAVMISEAKSDQLKRSIESELSAIVNQYYIHLENLDYYNSSALINARLMESNANLAYANGDIDYLEYVQLLNTRFDIEQSFLEAILEHNRTIVSINYILNK